MTTVDTPLGAGWAAIHSRFLSTLRAIAEGGDPGCWTPIAGLDIINASTGRPYRGPWNRDMLAMALGSPLDCRVATEHQITEIGCPSPAAFGVAPTATVLTPIKLAARDDSPDHREERRRVVFRPENVYSIDVLRAYVAVDGSSPWGAMPPTVDLPAATWVEAPEEGVLLLIPTVVGAPGVGCDVALVKAPHVVLSRGGAAALIRIPDPAQPIGTDEVMPANRLGAVFRQVGLATGNGVVAPKRDTTKTFGTKPQATRRFLDQAAIASLCGPVVAAEMFELRIPDGLDADHPGDLILLESLLRDRAD